MYMKNIRKLFIVGVVVAVLLLAFGLVNRPDTPANVNNVFSLQAPPFVAVAKAETGSAASIIEDEAGISAWFRVATGINLDDVRDVFRTIEAKTADYIIGSVPLANYPETEDVHVYVHKDGWILAYYLAADPVGKIFDWRIYHDTGGTNIRTKLENAIIVVTDAVGVPFSTATHYDFRYPNATHLMLIVVWVFHGTDSCEVNPQGGLTYYERSWSLGSPDYHNAEYKLDGVVIKADESGPEMWWTSQGTLTAAQLLPDQFHTITVEHDDWNCAYGGLALVYRVP
jgi:hypothetical protein